MGRFKRAMTLAMVKVFTGSRHPLKGHSTIPLAQGLPPLIDGLRLVPRGGP